MRLQSGRAEEELLHMKKTLSLMLVLVMLATTLAGCGGIAIDAEDKGAQINAYITSEIRDFDPAYTMIDDSTAKVFNLIYAGLVTINDDGKVEYDLMEKYEIVFDERLEENKMYITLKETMWSDGRNLTADDVIYAWKRILDPEFDSPAASLLYDIKNARSVKNGDSSVDDLGIAAVDNYILEVRFEKTGTDYDLFIERLASPALVPLREDVVTRYDNWATSSSTMVASGPFTVKNLEFNKGVTFERNTYYMRNREKDNLDKYVKPYRINVSYKLDLDEQLQAFEDGTLFYLGDIPVENRVEYKKKAKTSDVPSVHTYVMNTENKVLAKPEVRRALSMALDREAIAELVVFAKPATGFVPSMTTDKTSKDSFRKNGGNVISPVADLEGAKALLEEAKVKGGSFTISYYDNETERAIAEYASEVWGELGFKVKTKALSNSKKFSNAYRDGDYDILAIDYQMLSEDAFNAFASYATTFSGMGIDIQGGNYDFVEHVSGYSSEAYDALIESAYAAGSRKEASAYLHEAEEMLANDMPVIPVVFNQDYYLINKKVVSGQSLDYFGGKVFDDFVMKNYKKYLPVE